MARGRFGFPIASTFPHDAEEGDPVGGLVPTGTLEILMFARLVCDPIFINAIIDFLR
jgi:hypothetical protein